MPTLLGLYTLVARCFFVVDGGRLVGERGPHYYSHVIDKIFSQMTIPRFANFYGVRLHLRTKLRLVNVIWRLWNKESGRLRCSLP